LYSLKFVYRRPKTERITTDEKVNRFSTDEISHVVLFLKQYKKMTISYLFKSNSGLKRLCF